WPLSARPGRAETTIGFTPKPSRKSVSTSAPLSRGCLRISCEGLLRSSTPHRTTRLEPPPCTALGVVGQGAEVARALHLWVQSTEARLSALLMGAPLL